MERTPMKLFTVTLITLTALAQDLSDFSAVQTLESHLRTQDQVTIRITHEPTSVFQFYHHGKVSVSISSDGKVAFGEGVTPNEAAKQFAEALEKYYKFKPCPAEPTKRIETKVLK
jgi:hypothetical protein